LPTGRLSSWSVLLFEDTSCSAWGEVQIML
jgi:hypothetical protein